MMDEDSILKSTITSDDILGKDVIDIKGNYIGILSKLHIDKETKKITGITADGGFGRPYIFIGEKLIVNFGIDSVFIRHSPRSIYLRKYVFDCQGEYIGKVKDVKLSNKTKDVEFIQVKEGLFNRVNISNSQIKVLGNNIILNIKKKDIDILGFKDRKYQQNL